MWRLSLSFAVFLVGHLLASEPKGECEIRPQLPSVGDETKNAVVSASLGDCGKKNDKAWWTERGVHTPTINAEDATLVTVASNETDGFKRFARSAETYDVRYKVLGMGKPWLGGNMEGIGGAYKINLLKEYLEPFKDDANKVFMFTDSYDVILMAGMDKILAVFEQFEARVVFSAEGFCWPDRSLASKYPTAPRGKRYLNSGGFIGFAPELYQILTSSEVSNTEDDQLFYTKVYLNEDLRVSLSIKLDHKSEIFQNLNGAVDDVELRFNEDTHDAYLANTVSGTTPLVVHGNGPSKLVLSTLGNYLARTWNTKDGCVECWDKIMPLTDVDVGKYPTVLIAVFIETPSAFLEEFLEKIYNLNYPKKKLHLFVHNNVPHHATQIEEFLEKHRDDYQSLKRIDPIDNVKDANARSLALDYSQTKKCDFYFNVDSEAHLDNPHTLKLLIEQNRSIISPVLVRPGKLWSNFWGAMTTDGFYARSMDYMQIIHNERRGLWNVPYIRSCYLLNSTIVGNKQLRPVYKREQLDSDMSFCNSVRDKDLFMFVSNRFDYGHLVDNDDFDTTRTNPEIYELFNNRYDWEQRYMHENYTENLNPNKTSEQPCPDVFWFPIVTERFCKEFIQIMEAFGKWSDGTNNDDRLEGGYENVPTRDIHMKQVGLDPVWMQFLKEYVRPLQERTFIGYFNNDERIQGGYENVPTRDIHMNQVGLEELWAEFLLEYVRPLQRKEFVGYLNPPRSLMNFVVRYRPDEQPSLRPHHDSSTYTINLALNRPNIDFQGGGCRFIRYDCSVTNTRIGWLLMHPGRLTHYHEGLVVTNGTRYIMISFVDP